MKWLEWLKHPQERPPREKLGNLYLELCPDNRIHSFMATPHEPRGGGFLHGVRLECRPKKCKGGKQAGSGQPAAGLLRNTGKDASPDGEAAGETTGGGLEIRAQMRRGYRRKSGSAQAGGLSAGAGKENKPHQPQGDGAFTRLSELRGL